MIATARALRPWTRTEARAAVSQAWSRIANGIDRHARQANTSFMTWLWTTALAANYLVAVFVIASILRRQKEPMAMLAWIFAIMLAPLAGWMLYWLVGSTRMLLAGAHRQPEFGRRTINQLRRRKDSRTIARFGPYGYDPVIAAELSALPSQYQCAMR